MGEAFFVPIQVDYIMAVDNDVNFKFLLPFILYFLVSVVEFCRHTNAGKCLDTLIGVDK